MEEPKKILRAHYLGCTQVANATGMDALNDSIDRLVVSTSQDQWQNVNISIAPSMITIHHPNVSTFSLFYFTCFVISFCYKYSNPYSFWKYVEYKVIFPL